MLTRTHEPEVDRTILQHLSDWRTQWSIGSFGAIAEFIRSPSEQFDVHQREDAFVAAGKSGAIKLRRPLRATLLASETAERQNWSHRVALCLPADGAAMARRTALTCLGPDAEAIRPQDRDALLFDLGLGVYNADICIRSADPDLISVLAAHEGVAAFQVPEVLPAIMKSQPHRVFVSQLGRVEVFSPIPAVDEKSPLGSHTHILPKLLRHNLTHPATEPIPEGFVPCAHFYPAHPCKDWMGLRQSFDRSRHQEFQRLLETFGDEKINSFKKRAIDQMSRRQSDDLNPETRFERNCLRILELQIKAAADSAPSAT